VAALNVAGRERLLVLLVVTVVLAPFLGKAFHMDDPLFLWAAQQIRAHPSDFYGFDVNWYGMRMPMSEVTKNPPGASYYIAAASLLVGFQEVGLHLAFLLPAAAAALGAYTIARRLSARPLLAALATVLTPAFVVSSTSLMSDTLMLAFWSWAVALWLQGTADDRWTSSLGAGLLAAAAGLTKYYGFALVPLLLLHGGLRRSGLRHLSTLLLPVAAFGLYQWATLRLYGRGLFSDAMTYAAEAQSTKAWWLRAAIGLAFTGGSLAAVAFFAPWLWRRRTASAGLALGVLALLSVVAVSGSSREVQLTLFALAGAHALMVAVAEVHRNRDPDVVLLAAWALGTVVFATFFNWTPNARSLLPAAPAFAILLARRLSARTAADAPAPPAAGLLTVAAVLALLVARADYALAAAQEEAAAAWRDRLKAVSGARWFQGHWGFQYYMERAGFVPLYFPGARLEAGDIVVVPENNTNVRPLPAQAVTLHERVTLPLPRGIATMSRPLGAGFYADVWGPLPFAVGDVPPERYDALQVLATLRTR
jgi:4-amino-4-deoxy-L-arabinose transferase-like glycosyltransferase